MIRLLDLIQERFSTNKKLESAVGRIIVYGKEKIPKSTLQYLQHLAEASSTSKQTLQRVNNKLTDKNLSVGQVLNFKLVSFSGNDLVGGWKGKYVGLNFFPTSIAYVIENPTKGFDLPYNLFGKSFERMKEENETLVTGKYKVVAIKKIKNKKVYILNEM